MWFPDNTVEFRDIPVNQNFLVWNLMWSQLFGLKELYTVLVFFPFRVSVYKSKVASLRMWKHRKLYRVFERKEMNDSTRRHLHEINSWWSIFRLRCIDQYISVRCPNKFIQAFDMNGTQVAITVLSHDQIWLLLLMLVNWDVGLIFFFLFFLFFLVCFSFFIFITITIIFGFLFLGFLRNKFF